ncbi:MAG TPA: NUDIX domain-containing protein [Pseudonocardiaceae bacterium]
MTGDYLPTLRATAILDAPPRMVAAAVAEAWLVRESVGRWGVRVRAERTGQLGVGDELLVTLRLCRRTVRLRVVAADERGVLITGGSVRISATATPVDDGTLLTYGIGWQAQHEWLSRRLVLRLLPALLRGARERAVRLAAAPVVVGAVIHDGITVLAAQRDHPPAAAGKWEFPGGRVEDGESERAALARECREELATEIEVADRLGQDVILANGWVLRLYEARLAEGSQPVAGEHREIRRVPRNQLDDLDWLDADRLVLPAVAALLSSTDKSETDQNR